MKPVVHLVAPAGSCRPFFEALGIGSARELLDLFTRMTAGRCTFTADAALLEAGEDEHHGGRRDDARRAADLQDALACNDVVAIVALRGGAWFSRVLTRINFAVLDQRTAPIAVIGFSELTTLVNIVAAHPNARGIYDVGPAFLTYGLKRYAAFHVAPKPPGASSTAGWVADHLHEQIEAYLKDVLDLLAGERSGRTVRARKILGPQPKAPARFTGGNLTVMSTLIGSRFDACVRPAGTWMVLEDFNDKLERIDRFLAHLTLAGYWDRCPGILVGDFHRGYDDYGPAVLELLDFHLPVKGELCILKSEDVGHTWPVAPLPLGIPITLEARGDDRFDLAFDPAAVRTLG